MTSILKYFDEIRYLFSFLRRKTLAQFLIVCYRKHSFNLLRYIFFIMTDNSFLNKLQFFHSSIVLLQT